MKQRVFNHTLHCSGEWQEFRGRGRAGIEECVHYKYQGFVMRPSIF